MPPSHCCPAGCSPSSNHDKARAVNVVLPAGLQSRWCHLRTYADVQNPLFEQAALAEYLKSRRMDRHGQQMRRLYGSRRKVLLDTLSEVFDNTWFPGEMLPDFTCRFSFTGSLLMLIFPFAPAEKAC